MPTLRVGQLAPAFTLPSTQGRTVSLRDFRGQRVVLYFYPKDDTPGCTTEACEFRDRLPAFTAQDAVILGISSDAPASHQRFTPPHGSPALEPRPFEKGRGECGEEGESPKGDSPKPRALARGAGFTEDVFGLHDRGIIRRSRKRKGDDFVQAGGGAHDAVSEAPQEPPREAGGRTRFCGGFLDALGDLYPARDGIYSASAQLRNSHPGVHALCRNG